MRPPIDRWGVTADLVSLVGGHRNVAFRTTGLALGRELVFQSTRRTEAALRWLTEVHKISRDVGFVVPEQIEGRSGNLIECGWTCECFVEGELFSPGDLPTVLPLIAAFHEATASVPQRPGFLTSRDLIEQVCGGDADLRAMPADLVSCRRKAWLSVSERGQAVIHGDLNAANLIRCPDGRPALIDWDECRRDLVLFDMAAVRDGDEDERRACLTWEVACSWQIEPDHARQVASRL